MQTRTKLTHCVYPVFTDRIQKEGTTEQDQFNTELHQVTDRNRDFNL
jgi:hypothetical protein